MKKIITAAAGVAMLVAAPVAAYAANDTMTATVASAQSMSRQTGSEVNVSGTWETERLTIGQSFTAPEGVEVCMVYPPEQVRVPDGRTSVTNHAEVNGVKLEATTPSDKPQSDPTPSPAPSDKPQSDPTPTPVETTPVPVPSVSPSAPAPVEKPQGAQGGTQGKLAKTGATPAGLIGAGILAAGGVALAVARYKRR